MDQIIKDQWVAALRSGQFKQGTHVLHNPNKNEYCCLGVLCELGVAAGVVSYTEVGISLMSEGIPAMYYDGEAEFLPTSVCLWAGLPSTPAIHEWAAIPRPLPDLNDVTKLSFDEIADLIERYL